MEAQDGSQLQQALKAIDRQEDERGRPSQGGGNRSQHHDKAAEELGCRPAHT